MTRIYFVFICTLFSIFANAQVYPTADFNYIPLLPNMHDTVSFQNLSTNGNAYKWYFRDPSSAANDSSALINPRHVFDSAGTFIVQLIAYNDDLTDTFSLAVTVSPVNTTYTFRGNGYWSTPANWRGNAVPPANLPATNAIVINPVVHGQCILDITQHIAAGASLTVNPGKILVIPGSLNIQ